MKKRTLNQTWTLCLRMWRSIAKEWQDGDDVQILKRKWLDKNGFKAEPIYCNCFFCAYAGENYCPTRCPGKLVNPSFSCSNSMYSYEYYPVVFYKELLRLNRIRKAKK